MRRSRRVDWLLLATLLPLYGVMLVGGIRAHLAAGERTLPFRLSGAQGARGHPIVLSLKTPNPEVQPGDRVLRLGDLDLRGLSNVGLDDRSLPLLRAGRPFEVERGGERLLARAAPLPDPSWWWPTPFWAGLVLVATFLLLRAPHWHLARLFFGLCVAWACFGAGLGPSRVPHFVGSVLAYPLAVGLTLWFFFSWVESARPSRWHLGFAFTIGLVAAGSQAASLVVTTPLGATPWALAAAIGVVFIALSLAALARAYRRSAALERRKLRWIVYAHIVGMIPIGLVFALQQILPMVGEAVTSLA
jgi:hypothetical protein